jgi:hypothetical protein
MKALSAVVATAVLVFPPSVEARPLTPSMSCNAAAGIVTQQGAVVLDTGPHTYDRFVRNRSFCEITEYVEPAWVRTADNPQCFIGYTCTEQNPFFR